MKPAEVEVEHRSKPGAEILYNVLQMLAFTFMAVMIMRLKLFMTPMMCICASLLANKLVCLLYLVYINNYDVYMCFFAG